MIYPLLLALGVVTLLLYIREKIRARSLKAALIKTLVSVLFLAVAVYGSYLAALRGRTAPLCPFVVLGLLFGLLGDVFLDLKYVFPEQDGPFTYAGFCVFGIGHVLYIAGMLLSYYPSGRPLFVLVPLLLGALMSGGNALLERPMGLRYGKLKPIVLAYGFLLFSMVLLAGALALSRGWRETPLNLIFVGGVLFALSDLVLSGTYFGTGKDRPIDIILNYLTYYPGQFLIASALVFLV